MTNKVTALIPTYRRPKFLKRAILSVLTQTYNHLQVSVFDNASGDTTEDVVTSLSANDIRIKYYRHTNNIGSLKNFKYAFESVDTPYFSVLSDDDFLAKDFYENAVSILDNHADVMFVILNTLRVDEKANLIANRNSDEVLYLYCGEDRFDVLHSGAIPTTWTGILFRKEVAQIYVEANNEFDIAADARFLQHAVARYKFAYLSKVGAFFTVHPCSISESRKNFDLVHHAVQISRYIEIFYDDNVSSSMKARVIVYLRKMFLNPKPSLFDTLKRAIKTICVDFDENNTLFHKDIMDSKSAGFTSTSLLLKFFYQNRLIKNIVRALFLSYYNCRKARAQSKCMSLQNGIYKNLFDDIKEIS